MDWSLLTIVLALASVFLGSLLQSATGLGSGLIITPLLAFISYTLVPGPMIFASIALSLPMTIRGWSHIDFHRLGYLVGGLCIGTVLAGIGISSLPMESLGLVFGMLILLAVLLSIAFTEIHIRGSKLVPVGILSGIMGTSAGVGAPILALVYQNEKGPVIRGTLAFLYLFSSVIMLVALHFAGRFGGAEVISGFILMPGFIFGYLCSSRLAAWVDKGHARTAVLLFATVSACLLIGRTYL